MEIIKSFSKLGKDDAAIAGGKGASLGQMTQSGIPVPPGFAILTDAFEQFITQNGLAIEIDAMLEKTNNKEMSAVEQASKSIQDILLHAQMPKDIQEQIENAFKELNTEFVAVRSSATAEDGAEASWAGQLDTFLNITNDSLLERVQECWATLFTPRAISYRFEKGMAAHKISMAVVVQKMVNSDAAGIAFSVHPVTQDHNQMIIEAGFGLGEAVVSGQITPDSYVVTKEPLAIIEKNNSEQTRGMYRKPGGGNEWKDLPKEKGNSQVLPNKEILRLAELLLQIEKLYGFPVDIEWAMENGELYVVQSRPITSLGKYGNKITKDDLTLIAQRETRLFEATLRVASWTTGLQKEIGFGYKTVVINSAGEYYVDTDSENKISEFLEGKETEDAIEYIDKMYDLKKTLLVELAQNKESLDKEQLSLLFTYFFLARHITENIYEFSSPEDKKYIDEWRNDDSIFEPLDHYLEFHPQEDVRKNWTVIFTANEQQVLDNCLTWNMETPTEVGETIQGKSAYPGFVRGTVRIVTPHTMHLIQEGEIMVTNMTTPEYAPFLKKAAAFVTDEGGITSHAAIFAREMHKPCIVGTKNATHILKDGDEVEVDADKGVVTILHTSSN